MGVIDAIDTAVGAIPPTSKVLLAWPGRDRIFDDGFGVRDREVTIAITICSHCRSSGTQNKDCTDSIFFLRVITVFVIADSIASENSGVAFLWEP